MNPIRRSELVVEIISRRAKVEAWLREYWRFRDAGRAVVVVGLSESFVHYVNELAQLDQRLAALEEQTR